MEIFVGVSQSAEIGLFGKELEDDYGITINFARISISNQ